MNKHKKNLEALRRHLGRDGAGLVLLDDVAKDLSEQRKRIAGLEESESRAVAISTRYRKELDDAKTQITQLKTEVASEQAKRVSAEHREKRAADRIAEMEHDVEAEDEDCALPENDAWTRRLLKLSSEVRRRYKRLPSPHGNAIAVEDFIVDFTRSEFMGLGMVVAFFAMFAGRCPTVESTRHIRDANLPESARAKALFWMGPWLRDEVASNGKIIDQHWAYFRRRKGKRSRVEVEE